MDEIPLDKVYLIATWLEALFYGINLFLFSACLLVVICKKTRSKMIRFLYAAAAFQYLLSTAHVILGLQHLLEGFILPRDQNGGPAAFFSNFSDHVNVARVFIIATNLVVGDSIVVWRCYNIWGKSWKFVALPTALVFGTAACGLGQGISVSRANPSSSAFEANLARWSESCFCLSLATNVIGTGLVAFRVWTSGSVRFCGPPIPTKILMLVIESGLVYSAALLVTLVLYVLGSNAFFLMYQQLGQLVTIVPTTILLMVELKLASSDGHDGSSVAGGTTSLFPATALNRRTRARTTGAAAITPPGIDLHFAVPMEVLHTFDNEAGEDDYKAAGSSLSP